MLGMCWSLTVAPLNLLVGKHEALEKEYGIS